MQWSKITILLTVMLFRDDFHLDVSLQAIECREDLANHTLGSFFQRINIYFAKIPYHLFKSGYEGLYHSIFLILLEGMGIKARAEDPTNIGRIDLVFEVKPLY